VDWPPRGIRDGPYCAITVSPNISLQRPSPNTTDTEGIFDRPCSAKTQLPNTSILRPSSNTTDTGPGQGPDMDCELVPTTSRKSVGDLEPTLSLICISGPSIEAIPSTVVELGQDLEITLRHIDTAQPGPGRECEH